MTDIRTNRQVRRTNQQTNYETDMRGQLGVTLPSRKGAQQNELEGLKRWHKYCLQQLTAANFLTHNKTGEGRRKIKEGERGGGGGFTSLFTPLTHIPQFQKVNGRPTRRTDGQTHGAAAVWVHARGILSHCPADELMNGRVMTEEWGRMNGGMNV